MKISMKTLFQYVCFAIIFLFCGFLLTAIMETNKQDMIRKCEAVIFEAWAIEENGGYATWLYQRYDKSCSAVSKYIATKTD